MRRPHDRVKIDGAVRLAFCSQTDRQTDKQTDIDDRQTDTLTHTHTHTQTNRSKNITRLRFRGDVINFCVRLLVSFSDLDLLTDKKS